jgi:hypothetical protein
MGVLSFQSIQYFLFLECAYKDREVQEVRYLKLFQNFSRFICYN